MCQNTKNHLLLKLHSVLVMLALCIFTIPITKAQQGPTTPITQDCPQETVSQAVGYAPDVLIELGAKVIRDNQRNLVPGAHIWQRSHITAQVFRSLPRPPYIIVTGRNPEARLMKQLLLRFGVPNEKIIEEPRARSTRENARNSLRIVRRLGFHRPLVLTTKVRLPNGFIDNHARRSYLDFNYYRRLHAQPRRSPQWYRTLRGRHIASNTFSQTNPLLPFLDGYNMNLATVSCNVSPNLSPAFYILAP